MTATRQTQSIHVATVGVSLIAVVAFLISYSALQQTAAANGFPGWQSWLWPLLIDMPILVFAFTSLVIGWMTNKRSWFATSMIVLFSVATVMFNLAHAEMHWLSYAVAVMPPLALIVTFEALRELIQIVASHQMPQPAPDAVAEPSATETAPVAETESETLSEPPEAAPVAATEEAQHEAMPVAELQWADMSDQQREHALRETWHLSTREAGDMLGCHASTVGRARARLETVSAGNNGRTT